jgi:signal transduction histidine kinase
MKKTSLTFRTFLGLSLFLILLLFFLWFVQIEFLSYSYEKYQINKIETIVNGIKNNKDNINETELESYAFENDICIQFIGKDGVHNYNTRNIGCILNSNNKEIQKIKAELLAENEYMVLSGPKKEKTIMYAVDLGDSTYVYLNTSLEDLGTTTAVLRGQLIYITLFGIIIALIISIFITRIATKPIISITDQAKELSKGNYNVKFEGGNVVELEELAGVLTVAASEMNKTDELRRDLIANVSHDLKTPLTMIKAYAEKIKDLSYKDKKKMDKDLDIIIDESDRLNNLVNDLLNMSRIESNKDTLEISEYNLTDDINDILRRYDNLVEKEGYIFDVDMPKKAIVSADKDKIDQVLYNLINNAIEHTGDDLTINIKVEDNKDNYLISIKDSGKGIPKEEIPLVWNKYYTKKKNYKRNTVGTGIGLSIVKSILEAHKVEYGIDSKVNKYTTFYFKLNKK